jgi:tripartite-type tricarboxylate transporter receptor subunit TctC
MQRRIFLVLALLTTFTPEVNAAAPYPDRPIHIIVPFPPGAGNDLLARTIGAKLSDSLGQPVIIDNRAGAGGNVGTELAAHAAADGYTILIINNAQTINAAINQKLQFDVVRDFTGISMLATTPILLATSKAFPAKTVTDIVTLAKAQPGKINFGSPGFGTPQHFGGELLNFLAGIKLVHVPYHGQAAATQALISGDVQLAFGTVAGLAPMVDGGLVNPTAIAGDQRIGQYPDIPTIAESGFPTFNIYIWYGFVAPAGTPPEIVNRLNQELARILANRENAADLEKKGFAVSASSPSQLSDFIKSDAETWRALVKETNMPIQQD